MNKVISFNDIYWHDGVIKAISFNSGDKQAKPHVSLDVCVYDGYNSKHRHEIMLRFYDSIHININADILQLRDNMLSGNISNASESKSLLTEGIDAGIPLMFYRFYLADGYIEILSPVVMISPSN